MAVEQVLNVHYLDLLQSNSLVGVLVKHVDDEVPEVCGDGGLGREHQGLGLHLVVEGGYRLCGERHVTVHKGEQGHAQRPDVSCLKPNISLSALNMLKYIYIYISNILLIYIYIYNYLFWFAMKILYKLSLIMDISINYLTLNCMFDILFIKYLTNKLYFNKM